MKIFKLSVRLAYFKLLIWSWGLPLHLHISTDINATVKTSESSVTSVSSDTKCCATKTSDKCHFKQVLSHQASTCILGRFAANKWKWASESVRVFKRRRKAKSHYAPRCHLNKNDFSCRRNSPMSSSGWGILAGRLFQSRGKAAAKLQSPNRVLVCRTQHVSMSVDRSRRERWADSRRQDTLPLHHELACRPGGPTWSRLVAGPEVRKTVELPQHWSNAITSTSASDESRCRVLHQLEAPKQTVCDAAEQRVTVVKMTAYKTLHERHCCIDREWSCDQA